MSADNQETVVGFAAAVKPLFTETDQKHMLFMFDLWSYDDVKLNANEIYDAVADGRMPPGEPWDPGKVAIFKAWMEGGFQP